MDDGSRQFAPRRQDSQHDMHPKDLESRIMILQRDLTVMACEMRQQFDEMRSMIKQIGTELGHLSASVNRVSAKVRGRKG